MAHHSTERPLSPHLTIYKPQITSMLSIMHRATGVFNAIGLFVLVAWLWMAAFDTECYACFSELASTPLAKLVLVGWTYSFFYHLCNGIRHLFWDMGKGFALESVTKSGIIVLLTALSMTGITWYHILCTLGISTGL